MMFVNSIFKKIYLYEFLILTTLILLPLYFVKVKHSWISLNLIEILVLALCFVWLLDEGHKLKMLGTKYFLPAGLMIAGVASSALINKSFYVGLGILKGWFLVPMIFAVVLYGQIRNDENLLKKVFLSFFLSGIFVSIEGIYCWFSGNMTYDGRLRIFFDSPNQLAMFLVPTLFTGIYFLCHSLCRRSSEASLKSKTRHKIDRKIILMSIGLIAISFILFLTKSYGAWISAGLVLVVVLWLENRINTKKSGALFLIVLVVILGWATVEKYGRLENMGERSSLASRVMIWKSSELMIKNNPFFGIGPGNFQNTYLEYQKYFPPYLEWSAPQPHNIFFAFWLESGLLGLAGFIWLLVLFFRDNKKTREGKIEEGLLILAIILYFLIHGLVDTTYWRNDMAIIFWAAVAINVHLSGQPKKKISIE
jgi:O-antigen ligase